MRIGTLVSSILVCAAVGAMAQQKPEPEGARELFYRAMVQKDETPPIHHVAAHSSAAPSSGTSAQAQAPAPTAPAGTEAVHLGLRYNLVLIDSKSGKTEAAAPDRVFNAGDCFAIEFESNRAGFLYVLAKQSSGFWRPLLPSPDPDMATESNVIASGTKIRIPSEHCFEIQNPPGVETLFVVLSREPRDSFQLYENMKSPTAAPAAPPASDAPVRRPSAASMQTADASITNATVAHMQQQFGTRDIAIKKVSQPIGASEPAESVYVVNSSNNPSSNVSAQIEVHHR